MLHGMSQDAEVAHLGRKASERIIYRPTAAGGGDRAAAGGGDISSGAVALPARLEGCSHENVPSMAMSKAPTVALGSEL